MKITFRPILIIIAVTICCFIAHCDDSAMSIVEGGAVQPMHEHSSIHMVRETVDVKLGSRVGNQWPVFVHCLFEFQNNGLATDANMGFPELAQASGDAEARGRLKGFKSWVDGQPVGIKYLPSSLNPKDEPQIYKAWFVKKVHFDAGQTHKVVVVYSSRLGYANTAGTPEGIVFLFSYIMRSGANWAGPIGEALINVDVSATNGRYGITGSPSGYKSSNNKLVWKFSDFEPTEDIGITLTQKFPLLNGEPLVYSNPWEPCFERNGVIMTSPEFLTELGGSVDCDKTCSSWVIKYSRHILKLNSGAKAAVLDGKRIELTHATWREKDSDCFAVPLDEIVALLGGKVKYDSSRRPNVLLKQQTRKGDL